MNKQRNPDIDFGFHATVPRSIRTGYKDLTPVQKWLYVCLKDLCGEHGTCYRTVKVLAEETGISTGMISESIPVLHKAGLIHAEKKKRSSGGKEVWHITIVDIWAANGKLHPTKRSHSEQTLENVHTVNDNVHHVNDDSQERSHSEQERSHSETEAVSLSSIISEAVSPEEERESSPAHRDARASAHTPSASSSEQKLQQIIEDKTANGVGSPPAPSKEALNRTPETSSPRQKGTRKPKAEQVEKVTMSPARIESVFEYFDELGAEVTGDPSYCYERSKINKECIGNLLSVPKRVVTRESLRSVYLKLWTSPPDPVTGFSWQDNMSIKAVCRNYDRILLSIKGKDKAKSPSEQHKTLSGKQRVEVPDDIFAAMMNASGGGGY